jgi:hypothetical protein
MHHARTILSPLLLACAAALGGCVDAGPDPELGELQSELSVWQWPDDTAIASKTSTRQVAMAPFDGRLHMAYTKYDSTTSTELMTTRWNGSNWSTALTTGVYTDSRPALATLGTQLHLFYKPAGQGRLMMMVNPGNGVWTSPVTVGRSLGGYVPSAPHALEYGGKLYLTYCASNGTSSVVNVDRYDGTSWTAFRQLTATTNSAYLCQSALMAAMPDTGEVEIIYNVIDNNWSTGRYSSVARQRGVIGRSTTVWYAGEVLPMKSYKPLSVVTCDGVTHLVHGGYSTITEIWWSYRENGDWVTDAEVPNQWSGAGAALGCYGTQTLMVHNVSGGTQLMQSIFGP